MDKHGPINRQRLLDRFLRYVRVGTTANPESSSYPSSPGQLELGRILAEELREMGLVDARRDDFGLVWALVPGNVENAPTILLNAHLDTSPDAPGHEVNPRVIERYAGGDIPLGDAAADDRGLTIRVADCPALEDLVGHTLVTTDGRTLLGGDDKAGVAVIMELAEHLLEHPELPHGPIQLLFTCDEEIGMGTAKIPMDDLCAIAGYTLDGGGEGKLEGENFSADQLTVKAIGCNIHPSIGKGRMINAVRALSKLISELPLDRLSPESTEGHEGFLHPYSITGGVGQAELKMLLRDFDWRQFDAYESMVREIAGRVEQSMPGVRFEITRQRQYRNMAEFLQKLPMVMDLAERAFVQLGRSCERTSIRGGTDGAMMSEKGLPTPNLSVGQHNLHSPLEFVSLDQMMMAAEHLIVLADLWQQHGRS